MALSPNAGKDTYLLEKQTGIVHYLKNETEQCKVLEVGRDKSVLAQTYRQAEELSLIKYGIPAKLCKYCCAE